MWKKGKKKERKQLEKKLLFYSCLKFADPTNRVYLQPNKSNNTYFTLTDADESEQRISSELSFCWHYIVTVYKHSEERRWMNGWR